MRTNRIPIASAINGSISDDANQAQTVNDDNVAIPKGGDDGSSATLRR